MTVTDLRTGALQLALLMWMVGCGGSSGGESMGAGADTPRGLSSSLSGLVTSMCGAIRVCCEREGLSSEVLDACESELRRQWKLDELQRQD